MNAEANAVNPAGTAQAGPGAAAGSRMAAWTTPSALTDLVLRVLAAAALAVSGYIHAQLYVADYRYIHVVGVLFIVQAAASFALAALLLAGPPPLIRLAAAGAAAGALGGFAMSRTIGVFGFTEHGWDPAPQSLLSVLAEVAALLFLAPALLRMAAWAWSAAKPRLRRSPEFH